jgi:hypothetical protein
VFRTCLRAPGEAGGRKQVLNGRFHPRAGGFPPGSPDPPLHSPGPLIQCRRHVGGTPVPGPSHHRRSTAPDPLWAGAPDAAAPPSLRPALDRNLGPGAHSPSFGLSSCPVTLDATFRRSAGHLNARWSRWRVPGLQLAHVADLIPAGAEQRRHFPSTGHSRGGVAAMPEGVAVSRLTTDSISAAVHSVPLPSLHRRLPAGRPALGLGTAAE